MPTIDRRVVVDSEKCDDEGCTCGAAEKGEHLNVPCHPQPLQGFGELPMGLIGILRDRCMYLRNSSCKS